MIYLRIGQVLYPATFRGKVNDAEWDNRMSKAITLDMTHATADELFVDGLEWSIVEDIPTEEDPQHREEWDNSEYNIAGDIIDHRDGSITVKMGKPTALEEKTELLDAAETALREGVESIG